LLVQYWHQVAVRIERQRDRGVSQHLRDDLGLQPLREQEGCRHVPTVMEPYFWQSRVTQQALEDPCLLSRIERLTDIIGKYEI